MTRPAAFFLLAFAAVPAQAATCLIHVDGITHFDGPCQFLPYGDNGSFQMITQDGWSMAEVGVREPGVADAWWNEATGSPHAGTPLGTLHRDNRDSACWLNGYATLCAW